MKRNTYSRKQLYQEVWEQPMSTVSERYGISDVGLKKICKRMDVPTPPRGYWAKVASGQTPPIPKLPHPQKDMIEHGWGMDEEDRERESELERERQKDALLALTEQQHRAIRHEALRIAYNPRMRLRPMLREFADTSGCEGLVRKANNPQSYSYDKLVSAVQTRRVACILEALARAAEGLGGRLVEPLEFRLLGERVSVTIREDAVKEPHAITPEEQRALDEYERKRHRSSWVTRPNVRKWDYRFTGRLSLSTHYDCFKDSDAMRVEDELPDVFMSICRSAMSERLRRQNIDRERLEHEQRVLAEQRRRQAYNDESARLGSAIEESRRYRMANELREYARALADLGTSDAKERSMWIEGKADWMDPLVGTTDEVFGAYEGQEIPPARMRIVSTELPYDLERYYRMHGFQPDESWGQFETIALEF